MSEIGAVVVTLTAKTLAAGDVLEGSVVVTADGPIAGLELSVCWLTSGTGGEDEGVIHFQPLGAEAASGAPVPFSVRLPLTPTSYEGEHVSIAWLVRVRQGAEVAWDTTFRVTP
jgi:hypothetical protein